MISLIVHCGSVRQTASILSMTSDCLRTGDKAQVHFRFMKNPEYFRIGQKMVFREGRTKAIGNITKLISGVPPSIANKMKKMVRQPDEQGGGDENSTERRSSRGVNRYRGYRHKPFPTSMTANAAFVPSTSIPNIQPSTTALTPANNNSTPSTTQTNGQSANQ